MDRILSVGADLGFKERTMPVEARRETFRDPGSTPGASTKFNQRLLLGQETALLCASMIRGIPMAVGVSQATHGENWLKRGSSMAFTATMAVTMAM